MIEDKLPDNFKTTAFHPSTFIYAWKRKDLEKLFDELMKWNIAIKSGEVWLVERKVIESIIPLKNGKMEVFYWKNIQAGDEEWFDFVERSRDESVDIINEWNVEENVRVDKVNKIWYHFELAEG